MIDTFLFDLDGTLLPQDSKDFIGIYYRELCSVFECNPDAKAVIGKVIKATEAMLINDGKKTNCEVFIENFSKLINETTIDSYIEKFENFYNSGYLKIGEAVEAEPLIKKSIQLLKEKGYDLVVATNPLFPKEATYKRIEWAGLDVRDFMHITTYENSCYCKPNIKYYNEILEVTGKKPEQCIMVGNDVQEDIIVSKLGIKTFLITNHIINRSKDEIKSDYMGTYSDFYNFVTSLNMTK